MLIEFLNTLNKNIEEILSAYEIISPNQQIKIDYNYKCKNAISYLTEDLNGRTA